MTGKVEVLDSNVFLGRLPPVLCNPDLALKETELIVEVVQRLSIWLLQELSILIASRPSIHSTYFQDN